MLSYLQTFGLLDAYLLLSWLYIIIIGITDMYEDDPIYLETAFVLLFGAICALIF